MRNESAVAAAVTVLWLISTVWGQGVSGAGSVWCDSPAGHVLRVDKAPALDGDEPMGDPVWKQAKPFGRLFSRGRPEPANRATDIRVVVHESVLYLAARCLDPTPDTIVRGTGGHRAWEAEATELLASASQEVWQADSLEVLLTNSQKPAYPYVNVQVNAGGRAAVLRYLRPCARRDQLGVIEPIDPTSIRVRAGVDKRGWWMVAALPMKTLGVPEGRFYANVMRNRPADGSHFAWRDLWGGWAHRPTRLGRVDVVDEAPPASAALRLPVSLAVGSSKLKLINWRAGCTMRVNGAPVPVGDDGLAIARIERHGSAAIEITDAEGHKVASYRAEVARPLVIETGKPFTADEAGPIEVALWLAIADPAGAEVTLEAVQGNRSVGRAVQKLMPGKSKVSIELSGAKEGELHLYAAAKAGGGDGGAIDIAAEHWCAVAQKRTAWDKFRKGIDELKTLSLYRAGLADACNFYHIIQAGDGRYRSIGRSGRLRASEWSYGACYPFALVYKSDWPENPHRGDKRMLASAAAGMEAALDPAIWYEQLEHPPNRHLQGYLQTYELLKNDVPAEQAAYWRRRLGELVEATITVWITPVSNRTSRFSSETGTGTNHYAYHAANVYTGGVVLDNAKWRELGRREMRAMAAHERDGHFPERRVVPATHYTWLTMNALGEYYWQSADKSVLPSLARCVEFSCHTSLPTGNLTLLHDGRVIWANPFTHGDFVLSLSARGRHLARVRAARRIRSASRPSASSPEYWFRTAENAVYFKPGDEEPMPNRAEFTFLDGQGLIARRDGFVYGLNALSIDPIVERMYWVDPQNAVELYHRGAGTILAASNSQQQAEAGSFHRKVKGRTFYMPTAGRVERTDEGHEVVLEFDTFTARLEVQVISPTAARVTVRVLDVKGDEPVIFSFFPAVRRSADLKSDKETSTLSFGDVAIKTSLLVALQRDFKTVNPYSLKRTATIKPVRAWVKMKPYTPLVLDISVTGKSTR